MIEDFDISENDNFEAKWYLVPATYGRAKSNFTKPIFEINAKQGDHTTYSIDPNLKGVFIDTEENVWKDTLSIKSGLEMTDLFYIAINEHVRKN